MIKYICDRCHREIQPDTTNGDFYGANPLEGVADMEVCKSCAEDYAKLEEQMKKQWLKTAPVYLPATTS